MVVKRYFGNYGIKGTLHQDLSLELALTLGKAIGFYLWELDKLKDRIVIGCDTKASSILLANVVAIGISSFGINVDFVGSVPLAELGYISKISGAVLGVYVGDNGNNNLVSAIRILDANLDLIDDWFEDALENLIKNVSMLEERAKNVKIVGKIIQKNWEEDYVQYMLHKLQNMSVRRFKIAINFNNGTTSIIGKKILERFCDIVYLNNTPNGNNVLGLHNGKEIEVLNRTVRDCGCDLGISISGDGTSFVCLDREGHFVDLEKIFTSFVLSNGYKKAILKDTVSSAVEKYLNSMDVETHRNKNNNVSIFKQMRELEANIYGAGDGSTIFKEHIPISDGIYNIFKFLEILTKRETTDVSSLAPNFPEYCVIYTNLEIPEHMREAFMSNKKIKLFLANLLETIYKDEQISVTLLRDKNIVRIAMETRLDKKRGFDISYIAMNFIKKELNI